MSRTVRFRLACYNLYNFGRIDYPDDNAYYLKLDGLVEVLRRVASDLAVVAEVRDPGSFIDLADAGDWPERFLAGAPPKYRQIRVGVLSRLPFIDQGEWLDFPACLPERPGEVARVTFRRPVPWVHMRLANDETLLAVGVHLKSRRAEVEVLPEGEPARRRVVLGQAIAAAGRVLEAAGLRCRLDEVIEAGVADHYAVLGDFNDEPGSPAVRSVSGIDAAEWHPDDSGVCRELFPASRMIPGTAPFSFVGGRRPELLDHILVSRGLSLGLRGAGVESQLLEAYPQSNSRGGSGCVSASDHAPVWADFELPVRASTTEEE